MKQHKNDLNPGPLTELVHSGRSCYQANLPDNDRTLVELPVEGHQRLLSMPLRGSPGIERVKAVGTSLIGLKLRTKAQTGNPVTIHLYPQVKLPGFLHCLNETEFRRRTSSLETDPVRSEMEVLYANSTDEIPIKLPGFLNCLDVTEFRRQTSYLETDPVRMELEVLYANSTDENPNKLPGFLNCLNETAFRRQIATLETDPVRMELEVLYANSIDEIPIKSSGYLHCLDETEFRRQTSSLETYPVRMELEVLYANSTDEIPIKSPEFCNCLDETAFRRQTATLETDPVRMELEVLYANSSNEIPHVRNVDILHDITLKPPGRNIFSLSCQVSHRTREVKSRLKTCFRRRKTMSLPQLVILMIEQEFPCEFNSRIFKTSKLRVCQS